MHLSENEGIENKIFVVTGGLGFVGSALCLELVRKGAHQVRAFDLRPESPWSHDLRRQGVSCIQGCPVNSFEFLRPLLNGLDYDLPKLSLEVRQALLLGKLFRVFYSFLYPLLSREWLPQPLILPAEVYKVGVTHYFSILKAKEELGYRPTVSPQDGMATTIAYWKERKRTTLDGPTLYTWLFAVIVMTIVSCAVYMPDVGPVPMFRTITVFFFRSIRTARVVALFCAAAHVVEAVYAWKLARKFDPANARGWFWQTLAIGVFSLRYMLKRAKK